MSVAVCVITYRRPELLAELIQTLRPQLSAAGADLVVVDNDANRSAESVVREAADAGVAVRYECEPTPGIPAARNRAVDSSRTDLVAFTDDDVRPVAGWLDALLRCQHETQADVVTGPVRFVFPGGRPSWADGAHCFQERRAESADPSSWAITSNVLIRVGALRERDLRFNEGYGLAGGSDTELFRRLGRTGATFAWAQAAVVEELVEGSRATVSWAVRRSYRIGNTSVLVDRDTGSWSRRRWWTDAARWTWWAVKGFAAGCARRDVVRLVRASSSAARAAGIVSGIVGRRFQEYSRGG